MFKHRLRPVKQFLFFNNSRLFIIFSIFLGLFVLSLNSRAAEESRFQRTNPLKSKMSGVDEWGGDGQAVSVRTPPGGLLRALSTRLGIGADAPPRSVSRNSLIDAIALASRESFIDFSKRQGGGRHLEDMDLDPRTRRGLFIFMQRDILGKRSCTGTAFQRAYGGFGMEGLHGMCLAV